MIKNSELELGRIAMQIPVGFLKKQLTHIVKVFAGHLTKFQLLYHKLGQCSATRKSVLTE